MKMAQTDVIPATIAETKRTLIVGINTSVKHR